jgi:hypothetical protein
VAEVPVEAHATDIYDDSAPAIEPAVRRRREAELVVALRRFWVERDGDAAVCRLKIRPAPGVPPLFVDLFNTVTRELVEAKATNARTDVRMAIGQLADYSRFAAAHQGGARRVLLLPERPAEDLLELLNIEHISLLVPDGDGGFVEIVGS